jgi:uncharacterized membrane protein
MKVSDQAVEQVMGNLLRIGVIAAAGVVLFGGLLYLVQHGAEPAEFRVFYGEPADLCSPFDVVEDAFSLHPRAIIQLGLLLLIATPVARVVFSVVAFARERDFLFVGFTLIVLAVLLVSLFVVRP